MKLSSLTLTLVAASTLGQAFVVPPSVAVQKSSPKIQRSRLTMSSILAEPQEQNDVTDASTHREPQEEEKEMTANPSTRFGHPLSEEMQEFNRNTVDILKKIVDTIFAGRDYAHFFALETIARVPYFSYLVALHWYETIGMWRKAEYLQIHFAEDWNEMHHLLIMESLGGADKWLDRFLAQHVAFGYYLIVLGLYFWNPTMAYNLNERIEEHSYETYDHFLKVHEDELKRKPAPQVAKEYYRDGDLYMFDEFQTGTCHTRRPKIENLYDVFVAIRDDEAEHVKTMAALQTETDLTTTHHGACKDVQTS